MSKLFDTKPRVFTHKRYGGKGVLSVDPAPVANKLRLTITESPSPMPTERFIPANMWEVGYVHILGRDSWLKKDWKEIK